MSTPAKKGHRRKARKHAKAHHKKPRRLTRRRRLRRPPARRRVSSADLRSMTPAMVDRLFWRAGFGPTDEDRSRWLGKPVAEAVAWLLDTPAGLRGGPGTRDGQALDPTGDDTDLVLSWVDRMVRSTNPFVERLTFFWHRHWANSRDNVSPPQLLLKQNDLFRRYADFSANRGATFRDLAYEVTEDPAMLRFLTGESNVRGAPNENYARELMELFGLGVLDAGGNPHYSENDVKQMAKALSGWQIDDSNPDAARSFFTPSRWYNGPKSVFGKLGNYKDREAVDLVLAHPSHPGFLVSKIWAEFVATPLDDATKADLVATYTGNALQLRPLLEKIIGHPRLFDSIDEPDLVKPPIVYAVGAMRAVGAGVTDSRPFEYLDSMGQVPYFPPTVAGWEGGLSWLNTNTALARFAFVSGLVGKTTIDDVKGETPTDAVTRAHTAVGTPWLAEATKTALRDYATRASASTVNARKERQLVLRTLILAGPDAQVM